jgi:two-component system LytT family response regulator
MKLRTIIIDDETLSVDLLRNMLTLYCPEIEIIGDAGNMEDGISLCKNLKPDVVLLDIQLSGSTGFDFLDHFQKRTFQTVFITAHKEYAIRAIKHMAVDYILKPVSKEELEDAVKKLIKKQNEKNEGLTSEDHYNEERLIFQHYNGFKMTPLKNIIRLEASNNYTIIHTSSGEKIVASKTLKEFETNIKSSSFIRIHKSHIINLHYLKEYISDDGYFALMEDGQRVAVSKSKQSDFLMMIADFLR